MATKLKGEVDFAELVAELAHGSLNERAGKKLAELIAAVEETGKSGTLTIKLVVKKEGQMCTVAGDLKATKPEHGVPATLFFFGQDGRIHREDPRQMKLRALAETGKDNLKAIDGGKE